MLKQQCSLTLRIQYYLSGLTCNKKCENVVTLIRPFSWTWGNCRWYILLLATSLLLHQFFWTSLELIYGKNVPKLTSHVLYFALIKFNGDAFITCKCIVTSYNVLKFGLISLQFNTILHNLTTYYLLLWPTWLLDIFGLLFPDILIELSSIGVEMVSWMPSMADNLGIQLFVLLMSDNEMQSIGH